MACECRSKSQDQLIEYLGSQSSRERLTTSEGIPIDDKQNVVTVGERGPMLIQDHVFIDEMAHFNRERIPERVVHAKGAGAFGYFEVTEDITKYCKADVFSNVGKKTPIGVRFSTVGGEAGSADTRRGPRGFAVKFYTKDGIWDLVGNNTPIFFIRDPIHFPSFMHTQKRNPVTHLKDGDMFWDFVTLRQETIHQVSFLFGDRGIPDGYRHMHGYGGHTFKMINSGGEPVYCKFHYRTDQGIKNLPAEDSMQLAGCDPDYSIRDLYNAIAEKRFPSWTLYIQVMTFEQAEVVDFNPFDLTKVWPQKDFPLKPVGKLVLDRNPTNYFAEVEQLAFSPARMVPGIEASPDKMLQGRLFAYDDAQRYRIGANFMQLPVNKGSDATVANYQRDGPMCGIGNQGGAPNYYPNSFSGPVDDRVFRASKFAVPQSDVARFNTAEDNYSQAGKFYREVLTEEARVRLTETLGCGLKCALPFLQKRAVEMFSKADPDYGQRISDCLGKCTGQ